MSLFKYFFNLLFSFFFIFLSLSYFFVPLYELLCNRFGWGLSFSHNSRYLKPFDLLLSEKFSCCSFDVKKLLSLLEVNYNYRKSIHFSSNFKFILVPVFFETIVHGNLPLSFFLSESLVQVKPDTSQLVLFNIFNFSSQSIDFFIGYQVFPFFLSSYIVKIQCFCFERILILGHCFLKLPVLFYLDSSLFLLKNSFFFDNSNDCIFFIYHVFKYGN